jgi:hypothetical protein
VYPRKNIYEFVWKPFAPEPAAIECGIDTLQATEGMQLSRKVEVMKSSGDGLDDAYCARFCLCGILKAQNAILLWSSRKQECKQVHPFD